MSHGLHGKTEILTSEYGSVGIRYIDGETVTVRCSDGKWRKAEINSDGEEYIYSFVFEGKSSCGTILKSDVSCSINQQWLLKDGIEKSNIEVGDELIKIKYLSEPIQIKDSRVIFTEDWTLETNAKTKESFDLALAYADDVTSIGLTKIRHLITSDVLEDASKNLITFSNDVTWKLLSAEKIKYASGREIKEEVFYISEPETRSATLKNGIIVCAS